MTGQTGYFAGLAAEDIVAAQYSRFGYEIAQQRWRSAAGEIDLIVRDGDTTVFVEVKKSRDFASAARRITQRQMARIYASAEIYLANSAAGLDSDARFDAALVDETGCVEILENAFMQ